MMFFLGTVLHSEKLNEAPLKPWCVINQSGDIVGAHCVCKAGLGEVCSHVAAVLYSLIDGIPEEESVTDRLSYWTAPGKKEIHKAIGEMDFTSPKVLWKLKQKTDEMIKIDISAVQPTHSAHHCNRDAAINFLKKYKEAECYSALYSILKPFCETQIDPESGRLWVI
ncbi:hypothetical protein RN001_005596 [Aquatica leii]|uniref:SWIM-type domain-containing protein n=1 Tax=Aquatica leii TaxID=1421715 RepID=A0AAN7Q1H5_9COLE|nr:hypothetical protein RN001_005596 [Aquatica leii]